MFRRIAQGALALAGLALLAFALCCDVSWFERHIFLPQQFFIPASRDAVFWYRAAAATLGALLFALIPFLPRGASGVRILAALLLTVPVGDVLVRRSMDRLIRPELLAAMAALTSPDARYGQTFAPSIDRVQPLSGRPIQFQTDAERRRISGARIDPALPSLVVTGESALAGFGLQVEGAFFPLLAARPHLQIVNLASPGYSAGQFLRRLEDALPRLGRPRAVVSVFMPGLIARSARDQPASGFLAQSGFYRLYRHLYWSDAAIEDGLRSIGSALRAINALAAARGASCVFLVPAGRRRGWCARWLAIPRRLLSS